MMIPQIPEQIANYYRTPSGKQKILDIIQQEENKRARHLRNRVCPSLTIS
jgi:hypothetical protein